MQIKAIRLNCFLLVLMIASGPAIAVPDKPISRPNIVLILADDLGFSDIAPYGSEINTPTLTMLAEQGVRFSNYHTSASCAPSRAMLLTGVDSHRAGVANIPETIPAAQAQHENYQGVLSRKVVTVATLLQDNGYHTYMAGKWHLGKTPDLLPSSRGFERTIAMLDTGADNWEKKPYLPIYKHANWVADGVETDLPDDFYSSRFLVDKTIEFIDSNRSEGEAIEERPFFAYLPFQAVHIPVQAPQEYIDRYMGAYDAGWHALRKQRHAKALELGLLPPSTAMTEMSTTEDWESLSAEKKRYHAKRMAVYAGMIEAMDHHIGRLIAHLKSIGQYDNTVFIFTSDNGGEASGPIDPGAAAVRRALSRQGYNNDYETLGTKGSFSTIGASFASAAVAPLAYYKFYAGEGGLRVPLIMAGNPLTLARQKSNAFTFVTDIAPTILALTAVKQAPERYGGRKVEAMIGRNLLPLINGKVDRVYDEDESIGYEVGGNAALFQGDYKIVLNRGPVGNNNWQLFNIVSDPGETIDLARREPQRLQMMLNAYQQYGKSNGVLPVPAAYVQQQQIVFNGLRDRYRSEIFLGVLLLLILLPFMFLARSEIRERK